MMEEVISGHEWPKNHPSPLAIKGLNERTKRGATRVSNRGFFNKAIASISIQVFLCFFVFL